MNRLLGVLVSLLCVALQDSLKEAPSVSKHPVKASKSQGGYQGLPPNVLLLVLDDVGVDNVGCYGEGTADERTPNLDKLGADGLIFRNAYANPLCSPTRATLLTGRYGFRTGVVHITGPSGPQYELQASETTLPELIGDTYACAAVGKWHLGTFSQHPNQVGGFPYHAGSLWNLNNGGGVDYFDWAKSVNGIVTNTTTYATTDSADETIALMDSMAEPWFIYACFNASHIPFHAPPASLHTYSLPPDVQGNQPIYFHAMTEAMDTEIGRLLEHRRPNTVVIAVGDNGTPPQASEPPFLPEHAKGTCYEGGINVPLIVNGPGVYRGSSDALVNTTDLYATIAELSGHVSQADDSVSMVPYFGAPTMSTIREWVFSELDPPGPQESRKAVRNRRFKLLHIEEPPSNVVDLLFDLTLDPFETTNLLIGTLNPVQQHNYDTLSAVMATLQ